MVEQYSLCVGVLASVVDMLYRDPSPSRELSRCEIRDQTRCGVGGTLGYEHYMRVVTIYPFLKVPGGSYVIARATA